MPFNEETIINQIAAQERSIAGIKASYDYAKNPDVLNEYPCVVHYIPAFTSELWAHHNLWKNEITVQSIVFVTPREAQAGKLKFVENAAIPFGQKWRDKFQTESVISDRLTNAGAVKFFLTGGTYGAGGTALIYAGAEWLGWVMSFLVTSA